MVAESLMWNIWMHHVTRLSATISSIAVCCSVLQCVAVCCSVLQLQFVSWEPRHEALATGVVPGSYLSRWLIHMCFMCVAVCCSVLQCVAVAVTYSHVFHDLFVSRMWLIHMCDMTHLFVLHDSFTVQMTDSYVCHDSFIWGMWFIHMSDMTHSSGRG